MASLGPLYSCSLEGSEKDHEILGGDAVTDR